MLNVNLFGQFGINNSKNVPKLSKTSTVWSVDPCLNKTYGKILLCSPSRMSTYGTQVLLKVKVKS